MGNNGLLHHTTQFSYALASFSRFDLHYSYIDFGKEGFNDWGERGYDDFVSGEVTKTAPSGDRTT